MPKDKSVGFNSVRGEYSFKKNPFPAARMNPVKVGPGMNSDQAKVNKMLQKEHNGREKIRGMGI